VLHSYLQPSVEILNVRIDEPVTTLTDLLLATICFYAFFRIRKLQYTGRIKWYFKYYFLTLGLGAATGGFFGHAFLYRLSDGWKAVSWILTLGSVALIAHALIEIARPMFRPWFPWLVSRFNILIFALALFYTLWTMAFSPVKYYTIYGMLVVVGSFSYFLFRKTGSRGMLVLMGAVVVGFLSAIVFSFEWGLSPWFNHKDISHIILTISAFSFYKGAALIMDGSMIGP
jgi:Family of unknown function (DUF6962)